MKPNDKPCLYGELTQLRRELEQATPQPPASKPPGYVCLFPGRAPEPQKSPPQNPPAPLTREDIKQAAKEGAEESFATFFFGLLLGLLLALLWIDHDKQ